MAPQQGTDTDSFSSLVDLAKRCKAAEEELKKNPNALLEAFQEGNYRNIQSHIDVVAEIDARTQDEAGCTSLHRAAKKGHAEMVRLLLDHHDADRNVKNNIGETPLHLAAKKGHAESCNCLLTAGLR